MVPVVTEIASETDWPKLSLIVAEHVPAATPVTVYVAEGPFADGVVTVAIPLHVSDSVNAPA